jgi:hypothetical protein
VPGAEIEDLSGAELAFRAHMASQCPGGSDVRAVKVSIWGSGTTATTEGLTEPECGSLGDLRPRGTGTRDRGAATSGCVAAAGTRGHRLIPAPTSPHAKLCELTPSSASPGPA